MKKRLSLLLIVFLAVLLVGCAKENNKDVFRFESHQLEMTVGDTVELKLIYGSVSPNEEIKYTLDKEGVVSFDNGKVEALSEGVVRITAYVVKTPTTRATIEITVSKARLSGLQIVDPSNGVIEVTKSVQLSIKTYPSDISNEVIWSSSDEGIASITQSGLLTTHLPGVVTITATSKYDSSVVANKAFKVDYLKAESIELEFTEGSEVIILNETATLSAKVLPNLANQEIVWESSDATTASVDGGVITGLKITGQTEDEEDNVVTITAKTLDGSLEKSVDVKVIYAEIERVEVAYKEEVESIFEEETLELVGTVYPENADPHLTWSSSDEEIASVSETGVVTAVSKGTVTIKATAANGMSAEVSVTVVGTPDPEEIVVRVDGKVIEDEYEIMAEFDATFTISINPAEAKQDYTYEILEGAELISITEARGGYRITANAVGKVTIVFKSTINEEISKTITINIIPLEL